MSVVPTDVLFHRTGHNQNRIEMRYAVIIILFSVSLLFSEPPVRVSIGVQDFRNYAPYSKYDGKSYSGFNRDLFDLFAREYNYQFDYRPLPYARLIRDFIDGEIDLIYPNNPYWNEDIKKGCDIIYSDPVLFYTDGVIVHRDNKDKGIENLKELGTVIDFTPFEYNTKIDSGLIRLTEKPNLESLLKLVLYKRIDGAYMNIATCRCCVTDLPQEYRETLVFNDKLPHTESYRSLSTIKEKKVIDEFNQFLQKYSSRIDSLKTLHHVHNQE